MALCPPEGEVSHKADGAPHTKGLGVGVSGQPVCITSAEKLGEFKRELRSQIAHLGGEIIKAGYDWDMAKYNSEKLNRLVDGYRLAEFAPFRSGGASHIDFIIVEEIPACAEASAGRPHPVKPGEKIKQLGLEIQVSGK